MFTKFATAAALATGAAASHNLLAARQEDLSPKCQSAAMDLLPVYNSLPTPPPALSDMSPSDMPDPCATPDLTGSASSAYAAWTSEAMMWFSKHEEEIVSAVEACPEITSYATGVPICTETPSMSMSMTDSMSMTSTGAPYPTMTMSSGMGGGSSMWSSGMMNMTSSMGMTSSGMGGPTSSGGDMMPEPTSGGGDGDNDSGNGGSGGDSPEEGAAARPMVGVVGAIAAAGLLGVAAL